MNLIKLFGLQRKSQKPFEPSQILHMWEDDNLMIELLPKENLEFVINETKRIDDFGKEHFDGTGFTDITVIGEKPVKTFDKHVPLSRVKEILNDANLNRIDKVVMQGVGLLEGDNAPLGYGSRDFAVILEGDADILENIWITGQTENDVDRQNLKLGLIEFGKQFSFIGVNWYNSGYYDLSDEKQVEEYINNIC
ncbi:hypothetical protein [Roseivirga sp. E12]|uniref:hypothetical protein n=1 Tax=Roseivirga sp. E12 TaxID=2819237 RepID=UPI001ABC7DF8|nr:hypothetical protein [Roseivirga sp. E12]MBO3696971.1 hypothetical protein [Roseivirga sp. E12]